jgi:hypothetical protein
MGMSVDQNAGRSYVYNKKSDKSFFERAEQLRYLGITVMNQNCIQEKINDSLKSGNASSPSVQNLLSSSLLSNNIKIKRYRTVILSVVLYGFETWSLILREEFRLRVFENRVLRRIFKPKENELTRERRKLCNE